MWVYNEFDNAMMHKLPLQGKIIVNRYLFLRPNSVELSVKPSVARILVVHMTLNMWRIT